MKVLLLGSGGREHALAWKIKESNRLQHLYVAPGNAGTAQIAENIELDVNDFSGLKHFVLNKGIDLVIVGPEAPLVNGIHDFFLADNLLQKVPVVGPCKDGAQLEGSKEFAKNFMLRHKIPTAKYQSVTLKSLEAGYTFLKTLEPPYVLKADGLAAGKGVLIMPNLEAAKTSLKEMLEGKFGAAGKTVVIEEFLSGIELSVFVLTDGKSYKILPEAKDYKRIGEGDTGLNTGGMGAISPVPFADKVFMDKVEQQIILPTIQGLKQEAISYKGFIFFGLMNVNGNPYVVEYNVRLGDPEAEAIIPRIQSDLLDLFDAVTKGELASKELILDQRTVTTVIMVSSGYPGVYEKNREIKHLNQVKGSMVFHAGTKNANGKVFTNGGRVLAISSYGATADKALACSYRNADRIDYEGKYFRRDIGFDLK